MRHRAKPPLTLKELAPVVAFYHAQFPTWKVLSGDSIAREAAPVVQCVTFDRLPGGVYRPTGHIRVLAAPEDTWGFDLAQKLRTVNCREHEHLRYRVVEAIHAEFVPEVDKPLVAEEVLELFEREAHPPRRSDAYSLAALNAYLGHEDRAKYWCKRFDELVTENGGQWQDSDHKRRAFLDQLKQWIERGEARPQLERVLQEERRKWGLA